MNAIDHKFPPKPDKSEHMLFRINLIEKASHEIGASSVTSISQQRNNDSNVNDKALKFAKDYIDGNVTSGHCYADLIATMLDIIGDDYEIGEFNSSLFSFDVNNKGGKDSNFHNLFDAEIECLNIKIQYVCNLENHHKTKYRKKVLFVVVSLSFLLHLFT